MRMRILAATALCCAVTVDFARAQRASVDPGQIVTQAGPVPGTAAQIVRTDHGISCSFMTAELPPGYAFSVWCIIEEPDNDFFVFNVGGGVANANGNLSFGMNVTTGTVPPANGTNILVGGGEFDHPRDATITLVVRSHGPMIPGMQHEQFTTVDGGCLPGQPNAGMCEDMQGVLY